MSTSGYGIFIVAGYGAGQGTGSASAQTFSKAGYKVAVLGRDRGDGALQNGVKAITDTGGEASAFPVSDYSSQSIHSAFEAITRHWPNVPIRVALWNA